MRRVDVVVAAAVVTVLAVALSSGLLRCGGEPLTPIASTDAGAPGAPASKRDGRIAGVATGPATGANAAAEREVRVATPAPVEFAAAQTGYVGRVLARGGAAVPEIGVRLLRASPEALLPLGFDPFHTGPWVPEFVAARSTTDQDGRFALSGVPPRGLCCLRFDFVDITRVPPAWRTGDGTIVPVQHTPAPGEIVDLGDLYLKEGAVLTGRVVGEDESPIAGALVRAARLPQLPFGAVPIERLQSDGALIVTAAGRSGVAELPAWVNDLLAMLPITATLTGPDGRFELYGVDPGDLVLAVTAAHHASLLKRGVKVEPSSTNRLGDLQLPDGCHTEVTVVTSDGEPIAGAEVLVAPLSTGIPVHVAERAGRTDARGRITVGGLPRGRALAAARRDADDAWRIGEPGPTDGELLVELPARYALTLTVLDAAGEPAHDVRVKLVDGIASLRAVELSMVGALHGVDAAGGRLPDGRFRIDDLAAGPWCIVVGASGCSTETVDVELSANVERTVRLRTARALRVHTVDVEGTPVADATIFTRSRGGERAQRVIDLPIAAGRTDQDGWCTVRDLPTEETRITAMHPLHGQVHQTVTGAPAELLLQFAPAASIVGRLTDGGRAPAPGRWVVVLERRDQGPARGALRDVPQLTLPDLDGDFAFAALQPGRYRLTAQDSLADVGTIGGLVEYQARRKRIYPWNRLEVDLHGGERLDVRLDAMIDAPAYAGPGAQVYGTVTIDGAPGEGALVVGTSGEPQRRVTSRVDRAGTFDLGRCPVGSLRVVVVPREVAESRLLAHLFSHEFARDVQVADGMPQELKIGVVTGSIAGNVLDWNGAPVADCRIVLFDRGGDGRSSALRVERTDAAGAFRLPRMPAGLFEVHAQKDGYGKLIATDIHVTPGACTGPLLLTLRATARVTGRVAVLALPRKGRLGLALHPTDGGAPVRGGARADGVFDLRDVPVGRYRVTVQVWGDPTRFPAGEFEVRAPATTDVVLTPQVR